VARGPITFVTEFVWAESYRFFFGVGTDFEYELALLRAVGRSFLTAGGIERGGDRCLTCVAIRRGVGGWLGVVGTPR
jgi:hypothetical protein